MIRGCQGEQTLDKAEVEFGSGQQSPVSGEVSLLGGEADPNLQGKNPQMLSHPKEGVPDGQQERNTED